MDNSTFSRIYNEYISMVYNLILHYVSCHEDAQDITQDVFIKIYKNYQSHNPEIASLKTWIYRITVNQCLDFLRSRKAKKRLGFIISLVGNESAKPLNEAIHSVHPGIAAEDKDELQQLLSLVNKLPDKQKTALILARIEDKPQQEVAEIMNISVKAVESLLQRARQNLEIWQRDSLMVRLGELQQQVESTHYEHLVEIKKLCRPEQLPYFKLLSRDFAKLFRPGKIIPPPPKD